MFEACVSQGAVWKKVIDAMKDLVNEANFDCSPAGITIQAMDSSHVALVHLMLHYDGFHTYQCERATLMGVNMQSLCKVLKITDNADQLTLRHEEDGDLLIISVQSPDASKVGEYQLKLMEIEAESLGIPEMEYRSRVTLPSAEFAKIVRDMAVFGDTVTVSVDKQGVKFSAAGDIGEGYAFVRAGSVVGGTSAATKPKKEGAVKKEETQDDDDVPLAAMGQQKSTDDKNNNLIEVSVDEPISLSFALRFFNIFGKGCGLSDRVSLCFAKDSPCMVEYKIESMGYLRFYLAPKLDDN